MSSPTKVSPPQELDLTSVSTHMAQVEAFSENHLHQPPDESFRQQIQMTQLGLFRLVVMGEIKKGKSSFINALCGLGALVPELSDVATSTIFKIRFGRERRYTVYFRNETAGEPVRKQDITAEEVAAWGTEDGNPKNEKNVDFIAVEAPSPILSNGLIIVDTPGVGGLFKEHRGITWQYAPHADAIFFVTDSVESPIGAEEVQFLKDLKKLTGFIYFVQTKADRVESSAAQKRMDNNIEILTTQAGFEKKDINYFVVSSKVKLLGDAECNKEDLNDSGFIPLMQFLNYSLKETKDRNLAAISLDRTRLKLTQVGAEVEQRKAIFEADSEAKQAALRDQINASVAAIENWSVRDRPALEKEMRHELDEAMTLAMAETTKLRPGAEYSEELRLALQKIGSAEEIYLAVPVLAGNMRDAVSQIVRDAADDLQDRVDDVVAGAAIKMGIQLARETNINIPAEMDLTTEQSLANLAAKAGSISIFESVRATFYGGTAGVAIAGVVGGALGSVIPVVGTLIGSTTGMILAACWAGGVAAGLHHTRETERARGEVLQALERELGNLYASVQTEIGALSRRLQEEAIDAIKGMVATMQKQLSDQRKQVEVRAKADGELLLKEGQAVKVLVAQYQKLGEEHAALRARVAAR